MQAEPQAADPGHSLVQYHVLDMELMRRILTAVGAADA